MSEWVGDGHVHEAPDPPQDTAVPGTRLTTVSSLRTNMSSQCKVGGGMGEDSFFKGMG